MTDIHIAISTVADGSMLSRDPKLLDETVHNREVFLKKQHISMDQTTRLNVQTLRRATVDNETNWCRYRVVSSADKGSGMRDEDTPIGDAIVTSETHHALILPVADCVAAVVHDPDNDVLLLAHLGRHSLEQRGGVKIIEFLKATFGSKPEHLKVWLTPAPSKEAYPIWALDNKGMKEVTFEQLDAAGIRRENITDNPAETDKDTTYYSYTEFFNGRRSEDGDYCIVAMMG